MVTATTGEENGEFCIAVAPATRTADILTQLVRGVGCQIEPAIRPIWVNSNTDLIVFNYHRFKGTKGNDLQCNDYETASSRLYKCN